MSWTPIDPAPMRDGSVGGDGAGESWSVRFAHQDHPRHTVTVYVYPVDWQERDTDERAEEDRWDVEVMISLDEWDRPWNEDGVSDLNNHGIEYDHPYDIGPRDEAEAELWAKQQAGDWHRNGHLYIHWNPPANS